MCIYGIAKWISAHQSGKVGCVLKCSTSSFISKQGFVHSHVVRREAATLSWQVAEQQKTEPLFVCISVLMSFLRARKHSSKKKGIEGDCPTGSYEDDAHHSAVRCFSKLPGILGWGKRFPLSNVRRPPAHTSTNLCPNFHTLLKQASQAVMRPLYCGDPCQMGQRQG